MAIVLGRSRLYNDNLSLSLLCTRFCCSQFATIRLPCPPSAKSLNASNSSTKNQSCNASVAIKVHTNENDKERTMNVTLPFVGLCDKQVGDMPANTVLV
jgi:hypothetical protein